VATAIVTDAVLPAENARHVFKTCSEVLTVEAEDSLLAAVRAKLENPAARLFASRAVKLPTRRAIKTPSSSATP
jgi:NADH dehydrogenase FAD-containing subunit